MRNPHTSLLAVVVAAGLVVCATPGEAADFDVIAAAKRGQVAALRRLVEEKRDVNAAEADGTSALMWAVRNGDQQLITLLLSAGANANAVNRYGVTPLSLAASAGNVAALDALLKAGAAPKTADATLPDGQTLLMLAAGTGNVDLVKRLIARGANVGATERRDGTTALVWAVMGDHVSAAQALIASGADVNVRSGVTQYPHTPPAVIGDQLEPGVSYVGQTVLPKGGWTALMYAAREGAAGSARALAEAGADLDATDPDGTSALVFAIINGHYDVAAVLIEAGADLDLGDRTGMTPLYAAVDMHTLGSTFGRPDPPMSVLDGSLSTIRMLLEYGANPDATLKDRVPKRVYNAGDPRLGAGATAFMRAARSGDVAVMRLLLDHGADARREQKNGNTPIMLAASLTTRGNYPDRGSEESAIQAITLCLERGLDINRANAAGDTAVHLAVGSATMIRFLTSHGARPDIKNQRGLTPLAAASKNRTADPRTLALLSELTGAPVPDAAASAVGTAGADN